MAQSNPIQQRMELLGEMWNDAVKNPDVNVVVFRVLKNDEDIIDAFFDYMLGVDTDIMDIAIQFKTPMNRTETFGRELLQELHYIVQQWNSSNKSDDVPFTSIDWKPDYSAQTSKNPTSLFVNNINVLTERLDLPDEVFVAPILYLHVSDAKKANDWIENILKSELHPKVKIVVTDTYEEPLFNSCIEKYPGIIALIKPELNMPKAMEQIAAMGNPNDPETQYRVAFMKLTNAVAAQKDVEVKQHSGTCIQIATEHSGKNPYWVSQIVMVYFTLGIYKVGLKEMENAIMYATKAIDAAKTVEGKINDEMAFRSIGQTLMFRGSLYCQQKKWEKALEDFQLADAYYGNCRDYIMQIECLRMRGYSAKKLGAPNEEINSLVTGARLGNFINPTMAEASSYSFLLKALLLTPFEKKLSRDELNTIVTPLLGEDWERNIMESSAVAV